MSRFPPEKSTFTQTCNLLSNFIKEKATLRDLNLGINGEAADSGQASTQIHVKPMNLFPQHASMQDDVISITSSSEQAEYEPKNGQMTIFYAGQVLVVDDVSAVKAKELMQFACKSATPSTGFVIPSSNTSKFVEYQENSVSSASGSVQAQNNMKQQWQPVASDLPIARRASLHRFLSKRKERASARGPYHLNNPSAEFQKEQFDLNL